MKKCLFLIFFLSIIWCFDVNAIIYQGTENVPIYSFSDNYVTVDTGAVITAAEVGGIIVSSTTELYNNGTINGAIRTDGCNLIVHNTGTVSGNIIIENGGNVVQMMNTPEEVTNLNVIGNNFSVEIGGVNNVDFDVIKNINATSFSITGSSVVINDFNDWQNWNTNVSLDGLITLIINDYETVGQSQVVNHVTAGDVVDIRVNNLDNFHKSMFTVNGGNVVLTIERETNYEKIDKDLNLVVGEIKKYNSGDKFVMALDAATNEEQIMWIKNKSYRFNHDILLQPIKVMNNLTFMASAGDKYEFGGDLDTWYVISNSINNIGGRISFGDNYDDFHFNIGLNFDRFEYQDDFNDFSGNTYGFDFRGRKDFDKLWINGIGGFNVASFTADYIYDNGAITNNPIGLSWFLGTDVGSDFDIDNDVIVSPFIGLNYQNYKIIDIIDNNLYLRGGADVKYSFALDGIKYEYAVKSSIASNGILFLGVNFGFLSVDDGAGISLNAGVLKDDFDYNYQFALNAKMLF